MEIGTVSEPRPSFSRWRKWSIGLNVALIILVVFSVVLMVNYLSGHYSTRFFLSSRVRHELSAQTVSFLHSVTNPVKVVLYYDRNEPFYSTLVSLLNDYKRLNPRISIEAVDYVRDAGRAAQVKAQYKFTIPSATNLIIFDSPGHKPIVLDGNMLTTYTLEAIPNDKEREFRKKPLEFNGEKMFTGALLAVTSPEVLNAYYVSRHGEYDLENQDDLQGYSKFAAILLQNHLQPRRLTLEGPTAIPTNCNLLIIAGPYGTYVPEEIEKIDRYLGHGGRLLVMFDYRSVGRETGLEQLLNKWGASA